jgi:hypothetical protein
MLTNLDFLNVGQPWPPKCEQGRMELYSANRALFEGEHENIYREAFQRIERVIGNFEQVVSYPVVINFQRKISTKTADFIWLEPPQITVDGKEADSVEQKAINKIIENSDLFNTGYENTLDVSRYGDGLFIVYKDGDHGMIDVTQPAIWYPVVDPQNIKRVTAHVLGWVTGDGDNKQLQLRIHERGRYRERVHRIVGAIQKQVAGDYIGALIGIERTVQTGMNDFAVMQIPNIITSDRVHGFDDYSDVDSIISELLVRVAQISRVLDKHASPSVQGPAGALERDPQTGEWKLKMGNYFPREDENDVPVEYVTWDGQLDAAFKQIEKLINFLAVISEMGTALFDNGEKSGEDASSKALRMRYMSLLSKVKRLTMRYTPVLVRAIKAASQFGGPDIVNLVNESISIVWQDGLPNDELERAQIAQTRTGGKATMSVVSAIQQLDGKDRKQADQEYERILEEESAAGPTVPAISENDTSEPEADMVGV